ncbi:hypothetical protein [Facklamia hominis]|uniref:Uncharacterized protein n=1 Tax=Facklamia hominis TaxID=178214 RepID=A0AAJ1Q5E1_9LACT|nr:hypothetical protein [Facklamia hominis]EPH12547.1 hypothetical protein HMPREF9260_00662 [Facklamia hominis ACS-120-V-Sch10]MDK7186866.1 hypothetical protein [Facklamia hominis]PKY92992.1 hypothetical protein CYJ56_04950 [Facklamia hominis]
MKLMLEEKELNLLNTINVKVNLDQYYSEEEIEEILDKIYLNESTNVGYNDQLSNELGNLADKIEKMRD